MFGIRCKVKEKTFRGQDFERLICSKCSYHRREKFKYEQKGGGMARITINCPSLVTVETYKPKRPNHIDKGRYSQVDKPTQLVYMAPEEEWQRQERERRLDVAEEEEDG